MSDEHKARTLEKIAVMQAYVDGKPIEHANSAVAFTWFPLTEPAWAWDTSVYRIATIPDSINWDHVSPQWKYMARDKDGRAFVFDTEPQCTSNEWPSKGLSIRADWYASYVRGTVDWKDSLVKRPD